MKRSVILAAIVSVMCVIPLRAGGYGAVKDEQAFRRELMVKTSAVTSIQASFVQEKFLSVFSSTVKSEGEILLGERRQDLSGLQDSGEISHHHCRRQDKDRHQWEGHGAQCQGKPYDGPDECTHNFLHDREFECHGRRLQDIGPGIGS